MGYFKKKKTSILFIAVLAEIWMVFAYFIAGSILTGSFAVSLSSVPPNAIQGVIGIVLFVILKEALVKMGFEKILKK